jgi:MYXO-CTERM domain-containing protein
VPFGGTWRRVVERWYANCPLLVWRAAVLPPSSLNIAFTLLRREVALYPVCTIRMESRPMTVPSYKRTVLAVVLLLAALVAAMPPSVALAQAPAGQAGQAPPATRTEARDDDDSGKWGLLGLLGLVGLTGLLRRDRGRSVTVADRPDRR